MYVCMYAQFHVTALMEAANAGHKDIVKELLKTGCKLQKALKYAKKSGNDVIAVSACVSVSVC